MSYDCPKGHRSDDADYCSECGLRIEGPHPSGASGAAPANATHPSGACPVCETPRVAGARFCEVCRYDFVNARPSDPAPSDPASEDPSGPGRSPPTPFVSTPSSSPTPAPPSSPPRTAAPRTDPAGRGGTEFLGRNLWAVVRPDRSLMTEADAGVAFPETEPTRSFPLDLDENMVGRANARSGLHPEIPVNDPSVSSRHLKICRRDGGLYMVDVGSSNGTKVNGVAAPVGVETPLRTGDRIVVGMWTEIVIESR